MPDDYYVSQYSGEEIDDLLGKAGSATGAVRYDAAQTLTDSQKQQARGNIAAAPDGLGLGANGYPYAYTTVTGDTVNSLSRSGLYWFSDAEKPLYTDGNNSGTSGLLLHLQGSFINTLSARQIFFPNYPVNGVGHNCRIEREKTTDEEWLPWEFVNPPLVLGVEYRTTERYLGKPVYKRTENIGAMPAPGNYKHVQIPYNGDTNYLSNAYICANGITYWGLTLPTYNSNSLVVYSISTNTSGLIMLTAASGGTDLSGNGAVYVTVKYTKTTD